MAFTSAFPTRCIDRHPTSRTFVFRGVPISLALIAHSYTPPLDPSYLSHIFSLRRSIQNISVLLASQIADALGMSVPAFIEGLQQRDVRKHQKIVLDSQS